MSIFFFFILVTIKALTGSFEHWKALDEEDMRSVRPARDVRTASLSRTVRTGRPSSVRVTPIKRVQPQIKASDIHSDQFHLRDKGAA